LTTISDKLNAECVALELHVFNRPELEFLAEYSKTMEPLAISLDQLQGDRDYFFGLQLPKLIQL
jgi:hypothetical protein